MFQKGDYVFYESEGICLISDVLLAPLECMPKDQKYYLLRSIYGKNGQHYVPVDSDRIYLRPILKQKEAEALVNEIPALEELRETDAKKLRAAYVELLQSHLPENWVRIIKTVRLRLHDAVAKGQKLSETERTFGENARRFLHSELALALGLDEADVEGYILSRLGETA